MYLFFHIVVDIDSDDWHCIHLFLYPSCMETVPDSSTFDTHTYPWEKEKEEGGSLLRGNNLLSWTLWTLLMMVRYVCSFLSKWSLDSVVFVVILQCSVWSRLPEENSNLYPALARIWRGSMSRHRSSKEGLLFSLSR